MLLFDVSTNKDNNDNKFLVPVLNYLLMLHNFSIHKVPTKILRGLVSALPKRIKYIGVT